MTRHRKRTSRIALPGARRLLLAALATGGLLLGGGLLAGFAALSGASSPSPLRDSVAMPVGAVAESEAAELPDYLRDARAEVQPRVAWTQVQVKRGDTLSRIFKRHNAGTSAAYAISRLQGAEALRRIRPGERISLRAAGGTFDALRYQLDALNTLHVTRHGRIFRARVETRIPQIRLRAERARIDTNLLDAARRAGIDFEITYRFAKIFGWQVDFSRDLRRGDRFALIFEEQFLDGVKVGNGHIVAAELTLSGKPLQAIRHVYADGRVGYYAADGENIERSFLRSPLEFVRVTSKFSNKRFHPILKRWRPHRGVDYGAKPGTPVLATAAGLVSEARRRRGYGNTIVIRHGLQYTTLYAHLRGFARGVRRGARVAQGQVIGYVGSTGWSTGPHLHYEFRIDGVHRNPLTVQFPKAAPIAAPERDAFLARAKVWSKKLSRIGAQSLQLAAWQ